MQLTIPELALVVLVGASGSGKSTFARAHFKPTEILSSDACRGWVSDDETDQAATNDAFDVLHFIARKRLARGNLTVIDATNVQAEARKPLVVLAREFHVLPVAIVLNLPERVCQEHNRGRADRDFGPHVVRRQTQDLRRSLGNLKREGFRYVFVLDSPEQLAATTIERQPLWTRRLDEHGPFDIIGDVHGCYDELVTLLETLGYAITVSPVHHVTVSHPQGRKAIFVGDLVDRGPNTPAVLRLVMNMVDAGTAICVPGNHDDKLLRKLQGRDVQIAHGLAESLAQLDQETPDFIQRTINFLDSLISHYVLDNGKLVVAHAGMKADMQGRSSRRVRDFALYGETTGEVDEFGLPVRYTWAADYRGKATVVYGHTPVPEAEWLNNTINIDTGCVFGGKLTALRYPERELVSVDAARVYSEPIRPLHTQQSTATLPAQQQHDDVLHVQDVLGKRIVETRLHRNITIREENAIAAFEVMNRFAVDPKWLIYLPPTMSPGETSALPDLLEYPAEAFAYYEKQGVERVVCQEKHMGSRAVVIACRDTQAAQHRFGVVDGSTGVCYTRTGRRFFGDDALEHAFLDRLRAALDASDFWQQFNTDWVCLDCELLPWSAKAQDLLRGQYAAVGAAAHASMAQVTDLFAQAAARGLDVVVLQHRFAQRAQMVEDYRAAYRRYCWPVAGLDDLRLAPFHVLATAHAVHTDKDHQWHMNTLAPVCAADARLLFQTQHKQIDVADPHSVNDGIQWWNDLTARGGEGMVVKPLQFVAHGPRGIVQPAIKCRGREYLRIIYGPEYTAPEQLDRLRARGVSAKRSLALREFALGIEALERFVRREPLRRVHECVFGVLALESEPVDPRL